jgi:hypothetical protein
MRGCFNSRGTNSMQEDHCTARSAQQPATDCKVWRYCASASILCAIRSEQLRATAVPPRRRTPLD